MQFAPLLVVQYKGIVGVAWHRSCYLGVPPSHPRLLVPEHRISLDVVGGITWFPSQGIPPILGTFPIHGVSSVSAYRWFGWNHNYLSRAEECAKSDVACEVVKLVDEIETAINELEK